MQISSSLGFDTGSSPWRFYTRSTFFTTTFCSSSKNYRAVSAPACPSTSRYRG
ncbi:MAG: hypothetical protein ACTSRP_13635 [Candidatus Helarchaeota archaeon]